MFSTLYEERKKKATVWPLQMMLLVLCPVSQISLCENLCMSHDLSLYFKVIGLSKGSLISVMGGFDLP